jgi:hypothetical protein
MTKLHVRIGLRTGRVYMGRDSKDGVFLYGNLTRFAV